MTMQRRETQSGVTPTTPAIDPSSSVPIDGKIKSHAQINVVDYNDDSDDDIELNVPLFSNDYLLQQSAFVINPLSTSNKTENPFRLNVDKYKEDMKKRRVTSRFSYVAHQLIDWLQSIYLSKKLSAQLSTNILDQDSGAVHPSGRVPLVRGIDKVVNGSLPAADAVLLCGVKPLRYFWYMLSGVCCDCIQLGIDVCLFRAFHLTDPSLCWILGFGLSIIFRHSFHRYLVFGAYVGGYWRSLLRMYGGYSVIMVISTVFNMVMTKSLHFTHYVAWIATLLWTGIVNYFILKHIWSFGGKGSESADEKARGRKSFELNNATNDDVIV